jgi:hypothetical protein
VDWIAAQSRAAIGAYLVGNESRCAWVITPTELATQFTNPTLMATRMKSIFRQTSPGAAFNVFNLAGVGLIQWTAADDLLPLICPDVFLEADFDWIIRQVFPIPATSETGAEFIVDIADEYMSAAKRRLETGSGLLLVFTAENVSGTFQTDVRCLIKE